MYYKNGNDKLFFFFFNSNKTGKLHRVIKGLSSPCVFVQVVLEGSPLKVCFVQPGVCTKKHSTFVQLFNFQYQNTNSPFVSP